MLDLIQQTGQVPTTDSVADHAGVSRRSVFRHYSDVSELVKAAYELQREDVVELVPSDASSAPTGRDGIETITKHISQFYEIMSPVRRAAVEMSRDYPVLKDLMNADDEKLKATIRGLFSSEIEAAPAAMGRVVLAALASVSSWTNWNALRLEQGLDVDEALEVMRMTMRGVLAQNAGA